MRFNKVVLILDGVPALILYGVPDVLVAGIVVVNGVVLIVEMLGVYEILLVGKLEVYEEVFIVGWDAGCGILMVGVPVWEVLDPAPSLKYLDLLEGST